MITRINKLLKHIGYELIPAGAYETDWRFGYDRWIADQYSCGMATHKALIIRSLVPIKSYPR